MPSTADRYSVSMNSVARRPDGTFAFTLSKAQVEGNWIPVTGERLSVTIRLYNPQTAAVADPAHVALPIIKKAICE